MDGKKVRVFGVGSVMKCGLVRFEGLTVKGMLGVVIGIVCMNWLDCMDIVVVCKNGALVIWQTVRIEDGRVWYSD